MTMHRAEVVLKLREPLREWGRMLVILSGVALLLSSCRTSLAALYFVPSTSMQPTLLPGDVLLTSSGVHPTIHSLSLPAYETVRRGDVLVFAYWRTGETLVKRVAGLSGDTLMMRNGALSVNGALEVLHQASPLGPDGIMRLPARTAALSVSGTRLGEPPTVATLRDWGPLVVPGGTLFMLGDNRGWALDSRFFGPIAVESVLGRVRAVVWAFNPASPRPVPWLTAPMWARAWHIVR